MHPFSLNIKGKLLNFSEPVVMGIMNITSDSFYSLSRLNSDDCICRTAEAMVARGAGILDIGACSTRPGSEPPTEQEELDSLCRAVMLVRQSVGDEIPLSVDTYRAACARAAVGVGADIVNDISSGTLDPDMIKTVAELKVPYILTHMRGTPADMQNFTEYHPDVTSAVISELSQVLSRLEEAGIADIIVDPGFGFAKTREQNYQLFANLDRLEILNRPIMVGISRKSMITKLLDIPVEDALNATTALHILALEHGASILRVHDVTPARECVRLFHALYN